MKVGPIFGSVVWILLASIGGQSNSGEYMYNTVLMRAAPGRLPELIEFLDEFSKILDEAREERPFLMRHSQGDHWDILMLIPMDSLPDYYSAERIERRREAFEERGYSEGEIESRLHQLLAWHEDVLVRGPDLATVKERFSNSKFFHVEMFHALPGRYSDLIQQRQMENVYLEELGRPQNLIFSHQMGGSWDLYTIGFYRDLSHFAESDRIPVEQEEEAAKKAGFESASRVGLSLRESIADHQDTLAVAVPVTGIDDGEQGDCMALKRQSIEEGILQLGQHEFDQDPEGGWRVLAEVQCYLQAAELIDRYIENRPQPAENKGTLYFHAGQMYAFAGRYEEALQRIRRTFYDQPIIDGTRAHGRPDLAEALEGWNYYVKATLSFLERDRAELEKWRSKLVEIPHESAKTNLMVVDRLLANFNSSYAEAYSGHE